MSYQAYKSLSAKASELQHQIVTADWYSAGALQSMLDETKSSQLRTGACMKFAEVLALGGDEETAFTALGL